MKLAWEMDERKGMHMGDEWPTSFGRMYPWAQCAWDQTIGAK
jgi:hypothetical protein